MTPAIGAAFLSAALTLSVTAGGASELTDAPRADGMRTPFRWYEAQRAGGACAPLALISPGAGGSQSGYVYLAEALSRSGFTALVLGHRESGAAALREHVRAAGGVRPGVAALVADRMAEQARLLDLGAALDWSEARCHASFRVLLGHSMGAETVMLEAGAVDQIGIDPRLRGRDRFDAYIALSPEGPGLVFPEQAWKELRKPVLLITGTRDASLTGPPATREIPWMQMPGGVRHCQWLAVIENATHMNLAGAGPGHAAVENEVSHALAAFLNGARQEACTAPGSNAVTTFAAK